GAVLAAVSSALVACGKQPAPRSSAPTTATTATAPTTGPATTLPPPDAGTWSLVADSPYQTVSEPAAWTGHELLVAQAGCCAELGSVDLAAFDPATHSWRKLPPAPLSRR